MRDNCFLKDGIPTLKPSSPEDLEGYELIDVRRRDEYQGELGHIKSSKLYTLGQDLEVYLMKAPKDKPVLFICRSGARSAQATLMASELGFKDVYNMEGGMILWNQLKLPVEN